MIDRVRMELAQTKQQSQKQRERNEKTFAQITGQYQRNPQKSGIDRLTLEVIDVYEDRLGKAKAEIEQLKSVKNAVAPTTEGSGHHRSFRSSDHTQRDREIDWRQSVDLESEVYARGKLEGNSNDSSDHRSALERALGQQVNSLETRLSATLSALQTSQKDSELLKLELLASKKSDWKSGPADRGRQPNGLQTRDLIRMDKQAYKLRLYRIDELQPADARELLKDVCVRFDCADVANLPGTLERVEVVMRLVPQMEAFIKDIAAVIASARERISGPEPESQLEPLQRLPELVSAIKEWGGRINDVEILRDFSAKVHNVLKVRETPGSSDVLQEIIRLQTTGEVKGWSNTQAAQADATRRALDHFRDLFQVRPSVDVVPKMDELYVQFAELQSGLARLKKVLDLDTSMSPAQVLMHAADAAQSFVELSEAMRKSVRRSSIDRLKQAGERRGDANRSTIPGPDSHDNEWDEPGASQPHENEGFMHTPPARLSQFGRSKSGVSVERGVRSNDRMWEEPHTGDDQYHGFALRGEAPDSGHRQAPRTSTPEYESGPHDEDGQDAFGQEVHESDRGFGSDHDENGDEGFTDEGFAPSRRPQEEPAKPAVISPTTKRTRNAAELGYTGLDMLLGNRVLDQSAESVHDDGHSHRDREGFAQPEDGDRIFGSGDNETMLLDGKGEGGDLSFGDLHEFDDTFDEGEGSSFERR
ncbi:hypothetical protein HKX48_002110 [Thoreauomyces humboldtii]|nr:hypothetical protein HKX48_002110 [Thoreauomyces humboldtii]